MADIKDQGEYLGIKKKGRGIQYSMPLPDAETRDKTFLRLLMPF